ncbi:MAG: tRNA modification GTPase MnmE [Verrucomicrobia bacterium ADurb.Bin345]|nr:MAG: tRNA modification GTPase MnmE [Verrucomicrobia bacterium ADurb.Bin345]
MRLQIGLFGRTNVGKSSFLNMVAGQDVALTSPVPGTTTDVVEKAMELLPVGPVMFLDTGGVDDISVLSELRLMRTAKAFDRADVAVLVTEPEVWGASEELVASEAARRGIPLIVVVNKTDQATPSESFLARAGKGGVSVIACSSKNMRSRDLYVCAFKDALLKVCPEDFLRTPAIVGDLIPAGGVVVLIVPIDIEAPKGRLILPQVQTLRDALDHDAAALVVKETDYTRALARLNAPPDLVVCDSQVVDRMVAETPAGVACTTFSILFARFKGGLLEEARGAAAIARLKPGDRVLIAESCSHHALEDDIGRVKIPRWLRRYTGFALDVNVCSGRDYPADLADYALVIHCGACMLTRREMLLRIEQAGARGVPITNYGLCISFLHGVLDRVLSPFPAALDAFRRAKASGCDGKEVPRDGALAH